MAVFAPLLTRLRLDAGFKTPYAYYHRAGGRRVFPFTFAYYLKLERGLHLPRPEWLPVLLAQLRIPPTDEANRAFVTAYLRDQFKDGAYESLIAPLLREPEHEDGQRRAVKRLITGDAYHLTEAQARGLLEDPAAYWAFEVLGNDRGSYDVPGLAAVTGFSEPALRKGLAVLARHKLAKKTGAGRWKSPLAGRFYALPVGFKGYEAARKRMNEFYDSMIAKRGGVLHESGFVVRADEPSMRRVVSAMRAAMESCAAYAVNDRVPEGGLFVFQTRVRKAFDF